MNHAKHVHMLALVLVDALDHDVKQKVGGDVLARPLLLFGVGCGVKAGEGGEGETVRVLMMCVRVCTCVYTSGNQWLVSEVHSCTCKQLETSLHIQPCSMCPK